MPWADWFVTYLWNDPEGRIAAGVLCGAAVLLIGSLWALVHLRCAYGDELFELSQDLLPRKTYTFSVTGELEVYDEGVRVMRNGTCVSPMLHDVWSASMKGHPDDRMLSVKWLDGATGPKTTDVRCGAVDEDSFRKLKEMIEHYGKG